MARTIGPESNIGSSRVATFLVSVAHFFGASTVHDGDYAAWAQAIGSIAAILVAVAVPWWQRHNEQIDRHLERVATAVTLAQSVYFSVRDARNYLARVVGASENQVPRSQLTEDPVPTELVARLTGLESREFDLERTIALYHARSDVLRTNGAVHALFIRGNPLNADEINVVREAIVRLDEQSQLVYKHLQERQIDAAVERAWCVYRPFLRRAERRRVAKEISDKSIGAQ
jgi:hypothetical protein